MQCIPMSNVIELLQHKHLIWHASQQQSGIETSSSGFAELDKQLGGGFPATGVTEIHSPCAIGELRLITPCLRLRGEKRLTVFINPPGYLCAEYLLRQGFDLARTLFIRPDAGQKSLWAAEQCLKSGCCASVVLWHSSLEIHQAKRLQVASETGNTIHFLFNTRQEHSLTLPVSLSLHLAPAEQGLHLSISRRKGSWLQSDFLLDISHHWPALTIKEERKQVFRFPDRHRKNA